MAGKLYQSVTELVGNTPLVALHGYEKKNGIHAHIFAKLEYCNPLGSVKDRIVLQILETAEKKKLIDPKTTTIVEVTSGNTGIAVAAFAAAKGYKTRIYMQEFVSTERKQLVKAFGADLRILGDVPQVKQVLAETNNDFFAATRALKETLRNEPNIFFLDQAINPANPLAHYESTGKEIWRDTKGKVDVLVAAVGTGGTISGAGRYLKKKNPAVRIIAVQPPVNDTYITGIHNFTDVPEDRIPKNLDRTVIDEVFLVKPEEAYAATRAVAQSDSICVGASSGAALHVAAQIAHRAEYTGKHIVVVFPDTGLRYLSTSLFAV